MFYEIAMEELAQKKAGVRDDMKELFARFRRERPATGMTSAVVKHFDFDWYGVYCWPVGKQGEPVWCSNYRQVQDLLIACADYLTTCTADDRLDHISAHI